MLYILDDLKSEVARLLKADKPCPGMESVLVVCGATALCTEQVDTVFPSNAAQVMNGSLPVGCLLQKSMLYFLDSCSLTSLHES